jgi:NADPH-dependent 2,4-dienoyl-CoA reductase/sulfur reductase-like enzyme
MKNLVIIGASDAGISAALRAREINPEIIPTIIASDSFPNFSICGLPYFISRDVADWKDLAHRTREEIKKQGVDLLLEHTAKSINTEKKQVTIAGSNGDMKIKEYDKLIIATGGLSLRPGIPGIHHPGVFFLRWLPESIAIDKYITEKNPKNALVIGAGYIGMEMSEALTKRGIKVTVVEFLDSVLPSVDSDIGNKIRDMLLKNGISIYNNTSVESITVNRNENSLFVKGSPNFEILTDMVLVSAGSLPNAGLGQFIGINTGIKGAFRINSKMETNIPHIYAAGDCVETWHRILQKYTYLPLGTTAHKQGRIAGENSAGGNAEFAGSLGTQSCPACAP